MSAGVYDFTIVRGVTFRRVITLKTQTRPTVQYLDLTGCQLFCEIRKEAGAPVVATLQCNIDSNPASGTFMMFLPVNETMSIPEDGRWKHDVILKFPNGEKDQLLVGTVTVETTITQMS